MTPEYWTEFVNRHGLVNKAVSVPENADITGVGAEIVILDEGGIRFEAEKLYPGIGVAKDGFVPVGHCDIGTGDPYFINTNDGPNGPLYRIYHDMVGKDGYDRGEAVDLVLSSYTDILKHIRTEQSPPPYSSPAAGSESGEA